MKGTDHLHGISDLFFDTFFHTSTFFLRSYPIERVQQHAFFISFATKNSLTHPTATKKKSSFQSLCTHLGKTPKSGEIAQHPTAAAQKPVQLAVFDITGRREKWRLRERLDGDQGSKKPIGSTDHVITTWLGHHGGGTGYWGGQACGYYCWHILCRWPTADALICGEALRGRGESQTCIHVQTLTSNGQQS